MRTAIRPLVTAGVALVGAAVIVANPVMLPSADIAIRAQQSPAEVRRDLYLFDPAFVEALAEESPQPTDPTEPLSRLIAALTGDGGPVSREAIARAYAAGVAVVSGPMPTGSSVPNLPAGAGPSNPMVDQTRVFQQTLQGLVDAVNHVGADVVAAAFAAGAVAAAVPTLIADPLTSAAVGDLAAALYSAVSAVVATLGPPALALNAIQTVIEDRMAEVAGAAAPAAAPEADAPQPVSGDQHASGSVKGNQEAAGTADTHDQPPAGEHETTETTASARNGTTEDQKTSNGATGSNGATDTSNGATDSTDGNKVEPTTKAPNPSDVVRNALTDIGDRVNNSIEQFGDELRRLAGQPGAGTGAGTAGGNAGTGGAGAPGGTDAPGGAALPAARALPAAQTVLAAAGVDTAVHDC